MLLTTDEGSAKSDVMTMSLMNCSGKNSRRHTRKVRGHNTGSKRNRAVSGPCINYVLSNTFERGRAGTGSPISETHS